MKNKFAIATIGILILIGSAFSFAGDVYLDGISYSGVSIVSPLDSNTGKLDVMVADQTTKPVDALFSQSVTGSNFTLASDTGESGVDVGSLVYSFVASPGHLIIAGDEIILLDVANDRFLYGEVTGVLGDIISLDRPIDHNFEVSNTLGREVITDMAVDGSTTPQIFSIRAGSIPIDITRILFQITDNSAMDDSRFGGLTALNNGVVFRMIDSFNETIFNFKTNGEIKQFSYDVNYSVKAPSGFYGLTSRITFAGQDKHGVALRIKQDDVIQIVIQDDLTGLESFKVAAQGHYTSGDM